MQTFFRSVVALAGFLLISGALVLLTVVLGSVTAAQLAPVGQFRDWLQGLAGLTGEPLGMTLALLGLALIMGTLLLVLVLALRPSRRREALLGETEALPVVVDGAMRAEADRHWLTLNQDSTGTVAVDLDGVRDLAQETVRQVAAVKAAAIGLDETDRGLQAVIEVAVDPSANLLQTGQAVRAAVKEQLEKHVGVAVAEVNVRMHFSQPDRSPRSQPQPQSV